MTREDKLYQIVEELQNEFEKAIIPVSEKYKLFKKSQDALYKYAELEQKPCDAISRQAAIEAVEDCLEILENLPLITPQPKTGYWISGQKETGALGVTYTEKICSTCGWNHSLVIPKNYCPKCGTKMTESENNE